MCIKHLSAFRKCELLSPCAVSGNSQERVLAEVAGLMASAGSDEHWARMISDELWAAMGRAGIESAPDQAFFFCTEDDGREWAILKARGQAADNFVLAWSLCRWLIEQDNSVVERVFQLERQRVKGAAPRARPVSRTPSHSQAAVEVLARCKRAVVDSLPGFEQLQVRKATKQGLATQLDPPAAIWDELWDLWILTENQSSMVGHGCKLSGEEPRPGAFSVQEILGL